MNIEDDTRSLTILPLTPEHAGAVVDLVDLVANLRRHVAGWDGRTVDNAAADAELAQAIGALDGLLSAAGALRAELIDIRDARGATKDDTLAGVFDAVGHRPENDAVLNGKRRGRNGGAR
jgi:hypothetical protein